jgi:hypothetical protein
MDPFTIGPYSMTKMLRQNKGNVDILMVLSENSKSELRWWIENIHHSYKDIVTQPPQVTLTTYANRQTHSSAIIR